MTKVDVAFVVAILPAVHAEDARAIFSAGSTRVDDVSVLKGPPTRAAGRRAAAECVRERGRQRAAQFARISTRWKGRGGAFANLLRKYSAEQHLHVAALA